MGITQEGIEGEQKLFKLLRKSKFDFFQPDAIGFHGGKYYLFECKHQEQFTPPPFYGHGLPKWQVEARLKFEEETNIKAILVVFDKKTNEIFWQSLKKLNSDPKNYIDTKGLKPRRVYNIECFINIKQVTWT